MKYICYSPQKRKYPLYTKIDKPLVVSQLQMLCNDVHNNVKSKHFHAKIWFQSNLMPYDKQN